MCKGGFVLTSGRVISLIKKGGEKIRVYFLCCLEISTIRLFLYCSVLYFCLNSLEKFVSVVSHLQCGELLGFVCSLLCLIIYDIERGILSTPKEHALC